MDLKKPDVRALIPKISDEVYELVLRYRGSITAEHNDGIIRTPYIRKMYGRAVTAVFEEVKDTLDPLGIFNPGKKVGGTMKYAMEHIVSTRKK
jgi:FAD/FMN-containing dehydrogenase